MSGPRSHARDELGGAVDGPGHRIDRPATVTPWPPVDPCCDPAPACCGATPATCRSALPPGSWSPTALVCTVCSWRSTVCTELDWLAAQIPELGDETPAVLERLTAAGVVLDAARCDVRRPEEARHLALTDRDPTDAGLRHRLQVSLHSDPGTRLLLDAVGHVLEDAGVQRGMNDDADVLVIASTGEPARDPFVAGRPTTHPPPDRAARRGGRADRTVRDSRHLGMPGLRRPAPPRLGPGVGRPAPPVRPARGPAQPARAGRRAAARGSGRDRCRDRRRWPIGSVPCMPERS